MVKPPQIMHLEDNSRKGSREFFCTLQGIVTERSGIICSSSWDRAAITTRRNSVPKKGWIHVPSILRLDRLDSKIGADQLFWSSAEMPLREYF